MGRRLIQEVNLMSRNWPDGLHFAQETPASTSSYSADWEEYKGVIAPAQHVVCGKESGPTSGVERFNCTLRQRVSRLVRKTLSFSKQSWGITWVRSSISFVTTTER
jgi:hypothetical protein